MTRRTLLGGVTAVVALTGCARKPPQERNPHPDVAVLLGAITAEEQLIALYESTKVRHPELRTRIDPLLAHHREHAAVLRRHYRPGTGHTSQQGWSTPSTGQAAGVGSVIGQAGGSGASPPRGRRRALAALRTAERRAAAARTAEVLRVAPGLAQLLASIGACEAGHAEWLRHG